MHEPYRNPIIYILRKPQQQRSNSNSSGSNSNSKRMTYTYNNNHHRKTTNNNNTVSQNYNNTRSTGNSFFMMKGTVLMIAILGSIILLNTILKHEILISLQDIISSSTTTTSSITRSTSIKMIPIITESNENTKSKLLRTTSSSLSSQTPKTTTTTTTTTTVDNTFRDRMISLPFIDQFYSYFDYDESDELLRNKDDEDDDDIDNIDTKVEDSKVEQIDNVADNTDNHNVINDDDNRLFQEAIRHNFNVSLYNNYHEMISRSHRFPSVEERIKVYMSNWYLPPILPCNNNNNNNNIDNDPRIQYNYITQYDTQSNETKIIVLLRQSQHISVNFMNNMNNTFVLTIGNVPVHSRVPFVYNYTMILQHRTDRFVQDVVKYFIPSLQRIQYPNTTDISMYQMNIDTQSSSSSSRILLQPPPPPIPILLQIGDAEQYRMYSPNINTDIYRPVIPIIKKFRYSMNQNELHRITTSQSELELESKCIENNNDIGQQQPERMARTIRIGEPMMSQYINDIDNIPHHVQPIVSILSNYERHFNPLNDVVSADIPWNKKLNIAIYRGGLTGRNRKITVGTTSNDNHPENNENDEIIWCQQVPRCNLVLQHGTSKYVNAKLVSFPNENHYRVQPILNNVTMFGNSMTFQEMLQYKAIIMLEGNDVSTGLKWSLYSNSVVLMPKPTCTSWAMEELLQPYVHYIPLYDNLTNVEEQVQWMIDHDDEAQQIAHNGKLWMLDLVYHPQVAKDTEDILDETFERYMKHFIYNPNLQL